ncbi:MAG: hypothetical protein ACRD36_13260, partial [Candidatus Acidiferrum sp.]
MPLPGFISVKNGERSARRHLEETEKVTSENTAAAAMELGDSDLAAVKRLQDAFHEIKRQLARVIVGQDQVIEELLIALFSKG